jgi:hypothetical protein
MLLCMGEIGVWGFSQPICEGLILNIIHGAVFAPSPARRSSFFNKTCDGAVYGVEEKPTHGVH